jgi:hypothetical protein
MNKIRKYQLFPQLRRTVLAVGIVTFLLGIMLFISFAAPECNDASAACIHHSTIIETEQSSFNELAQSEPFVISATCEEHPGTTGWTGALCDSEPSPTPPDCTPCDGNPDDNLS